MHHSNDDGRSSFISNRHALSHSTRDQRLFSDTTPTVERGNLYRHLAGRDQSPPMRPLSSPPSFSAHKMVSSMSEEGAGHMTPKSSRSNVGFTTPDPPRTRVTYLPPSPNSVFPITSEAQTVSGAMSTDEAQYAPLYFTDPRQDDEFHELQDEFMASRVNDTPLSHHPSSAPKTEPIGHRRRSASSPLPQSTFQRHAGSPHMTRALSRPLTPQRHPSYRVTLTHMPENFSIESLSSYFAQQNEAWSNLPIYPGVENDSTFAVIEFPSKHDAELAVQSVTLLFEHATKDKDECGNHAPVEVDHQLKFANEDGQTGRETRARSSSGSQMSPQQHRSAIARTYDLLNGHLRGVRISELNTLYEEAYGECLPEGNSLLKFLVQLDQLLLINRSDEEDVMIFITKVPAFRLVIDILRSKSESMTVNEFARELETRLCVDLTQCDVLDFLKRWRVARVDERRRTVRLAPMGTCTVFLGGLASSTTQMDVLNELVKIDSAYRQARVRIQNNNDTSQFCNAFVDLPSMSDAEQVISRLEGAAVLGSTCVRAEIESSSAQKQHEHDDNNGQRETRHRSNSHSPRQSHQQKSSSGHARTRSNSNNSSSSRRRDSHGSHKSTRSRNKAPVADQLYSLLESNGGCLPMSEIPNKFYEMYHRSVDFSNPKLLVKMDRLLLLNCLEEDDTMVFFTKLPAYRMVVEILKQHPSGISVHDIRCCLETKMGMSIGGCDFEDFLNRWRFLTIRDSGSVRTVHFTPHSGSTVFFGNLDASCSESDIYSDLSRVKAEWRSASVRLKKGKGFSYAFVDFDSREDALEAVACFDGKSAFRSNYVSADIEVAENKKSKNGSPSSANRATVYVGNLRDNVTKHEIQKALTSIDKSWKSFAIRLNLRSGWSHAFIDLSSSQCAQRLIETWHGKSLGIGCAPLRVETSKKKL